MKSILKCLFGKLAVWHGHFGFALVILVSVNGSLICYEYSSFKIYIYIILDRYFLVIKKKEKKKERYLRLYLCLQQN